MKLSIVATLYQSAPYIAEFHRRATESAKMLVGDDYEIVLVNDGSPDNSLELAIALTEKDARVVVVDLSRNFGHHKAMMTGLEHASGAHVFLIDSDLEEEPEWLLSFSEQMDHDKCDVVYGVQQKRKGGWFERASGELYYALFNKLCNIDHPRNVSTARLMTRRYLNGLLQFKEREMVLSCLWVITGFKQTSCRVDKKSTSRTTYSLSSKIEHATNAITSFSAVPLKFIFYSGIVVLIGSLFFAVLLIFKKMMMDQVVDGWTSVMVSIWFLGGVLMSFVGIIGIYVGKVFSETKQRPYSIVRGIYGSSQKKY